MNLHRDRKIVLLGMMSKMPVAGVIWQTVHYLVGLRRLGYDVFYVEAHARTPSMFMEHEHDDGSAKAAALIATIMKRFDLGDNWAFHALHADGRCYGLSEGELMRLYRSAALLINLHGGTEPRPEHSATGRLIYVETDPVALQVELYHRVQETIDFLSSHVAFFTFGENYGNPDCTLPVSERFTFIPTRQPVVNDFWRSPAGSPVGTTFTTIGNWRQPWREIEFRGEVYHWSKHHEFLKFIDLPRRADQRFELALSSYEEADRVVLEDNGWHVRQALGFSTDIDAYRDYIKGSRGEFTVAKDQNVRMRSGWFSDRSATYLAAGRPVITQDTGFGNMLPTGEGLFAFASMEEILQALERIEADYALHSRAACDIATDYFGYDVVLPRMLAEVGLGTVPAAQRHQRDSVDGDIPGGPPGDDGYLEASDGREDRIAFPADLVLEPLSRRPLKLASETLEYAMADRHLVPMNGADVPGASRVSIVVVTFNNVACTRLCLDSVLLNTDYSNYEIIAVDNGSSDGTVGYLREIARRNRHIRLILNADNRGFAAANNQGIAAAAGNVLVLLNNDTIVPQRWLTRLIRHVGDDSIGAVGPVTNRICNEAQIETDYATYGEFIEFAEQRAQSHTDQLFDIRMLAMFCFAIRREVLEIVGPIDERFGPGTFEDEDYAIRMRDAGFRVVCAEGVYVHHFGQASFGNLVPTGEYRALYETNRKLFEEKWGVRWTPYQRRANTRYDRMVQLVGEAISDVVPAASMISVISKGDEALLYPDTMRGRHFPRNPDGSYTGYYPAESAEAIAQLEEARRLGSEFFVIPSTGAWWMEYYRDFALHLEKNYQLVFQDDDLCSIFALAPHGKGRGDATEEDPSRIMPSEKELNQSPCRCSIIIPVYNNAHLAAQCIDALLASPAETIDAQIVIVDDGSTDETPTVLEDYGDLIQVVTHRANGGFAKACNDGAAVATGGHLVFLNSDTIPQSGWLESLINTAERYPGAAVVGSKLLFPNDTVQHAGVVICEDYHARHLYAGFPADHPAVNKSRAFQAVTAGCMLVRRGPFEEVGGFDTAFRNGYEDADLCLRLGERGYEIRYCHESVLYHLESVSEGRFSQSKDNAKLFRRRWAHRVRPDDLRYYLEDGLLRIHYSTSYPVHLSLSPLLATVEGDEYFRQAHRLLSTRARQVSELLRENIRLGMCLAQAEMRERTVERREFGGRHSATGGGRRYRRSTIDDLREVIDDHERKIRALTIEIDGMEIRESELRGLLLEAHDLLTDRDREIQDAVSELQAAITAMRGSTRRISPSSGTSGGNTGDGKHVDYQHLVRRAREVVQAMLPADAIVVVVSKGDDALLEFRGRMGWHFPQMDNGVYAGYYPESGADAIAHLEALRARGAQYFLIPATAFWWLEYYEDFGHHLASRYRIVVAEEGTCYIYALDSGEAE